MSHAAEVQFSCTEFGEFVTHEIVATQTHRVSHSYSATASLEWQFYIESLNLILVRRTATEYAALDDAKRLFRSHDKNQPPFVEIERRPASHTA